MAPTAAVRLLIALAALLLLNKGRLVEAFSPFTGDRAAELSDALTILLNQLRVPVRVNALVCWDAGESHTQLLNSPNIRLTEHILLCCHRSLIATLRARLPHQRFSAQHLPNRHLRRPRRQLSARLAGGAPRTYADRCAMRGECGAADRRAARQAEEPHQMGVCVVSPRRRRHRDGQADARAASRLARFAAQRNLHGVHHPRRRCGRACVQAE